MDWVTIAQLAVAGATLILGGVAVWAILHTHYWNKRNEERVLNWNKRNEWMHALPILSLRQPPESGPYKPETLEGLDSGWFSRFELFAENIGYGPILVMEIEANQGPLFFYPYLPKGRTSEDSQLFGVREKRLIGLYLPKAIPKPKGNPEMIKVKVKLRDIFLREILMNYEIHPLKNPRRKYIPELGIPLLTSLNIDGKEVPVPEAKMIKPPSEN